MSSLFKKLSRSKSKIGTHNKNTITHIYHRFQADIIKHWLLYGLSPQKEGGKTTVSALLPR